MSVTAYEGVIEQGVVRLPANIRFPDKTKVYVIIPDLEVGPVAYIRIGQSRLNWG